MTGDQFAAYLAGAGLVEIAGLCGAMAVMTVALYFLGRWVVRIASSAV